MKTLVALILSVGLLAGCVTGGGTLPDPGTAQSVAKLAVTYGVLKYCEKAGDPAAQAARCARVKAFAGEAQKLAAGESVTIVALNAAIEAKLPADLSPADRILAIALIETIEQELMQRVGGNLLKPEQIVIVQQVLGWVVDATGYVAT